MALKRLEITMPSRNRHHHHRRIIHSMMIPHELSLACYLHNNAPYHGYVIHSFLFSVYNLAASLLAGEFGFGSVRSDYR